MQSKKIINPVIDHFLSARKIFPPVKFSQRLMTNYALIAGGGRMGKRIYDQLTQPLSEESELLTCKTTYMQLIESKHFDSKNIRLLFGNVNPHTPPEKLKTIIFPTYFSRIYKYLEKKPNTVDHALSTLPPIAGENTYINIEKQLANILRAANHTDNAK